jgi:hypothetical protein
MAPRRRSGPFHLAAYLGAVVQPTPPALPVPRSAVRHFSSGADPAFRRSKHHPQAAMRGVSAAVVGLLGAALYCRSDKLGESAGRFRLRLSARPLTVWRLPPLVVVIVRRALQCGAAFAKKRSEAGGFFRRNFGGLSRTHFARSQRHVCRHFDRDALSGSADLHPTLHATGSIVGLVDGFAQALQNIVQDLPGTLSDKLQRRKPIALFGYFIAAIAKPPHGIGDGLAGPVGAPLDHSAPVRSAPRDALIAASVDEQGAAAPRAGRPGDNAGAWPAPHAVSALLFRSASAGCSISPSFPG